MAKTDDVRCYLCDTMVDNEEAWCFGCKQFIREDCDECSPIGSHEPHEHKEDDY